MADKFLELSDNVVTNLKASKDVDDNFVMDITSLRGCTGIITNDFLVDAYNAEVVEEIYANGAFNLQVLVVIKAADYGISSGAATRGLNYGIPANKADLSQRLGRCGRRTRNDDELYDKFSIIINFQCIISIVCIIQIYCI